MANVFVINFIRWSTTVTATANYSQQSQIDCNDNKNLTSKSNSPQRKQDPHSTNENSHSTNENAHSTTKSRRFIVPLSRFEERGNHLAVAGEDLCRSS